MMSGLLTLAAAVVSVTIHVWLASGVLTPIAGNSIEYLFISATARSAVAIALVTATLVLVAHLAIRRRAARRFVQPPLFSWADTAYMAPLCWFAISALALLNLIPSVSRWFSVASYAIVDLRWWWIGLVLAWTAWRLDARLGAAERSRIGNLRPSGQPPTPSGGTEVAGRDLVRRRWLSEAVLAALAVTWSFLGTPIERVNGGATGDEPKYLRYCENWYQGLGFEVAQIKPMAELPADFRPRLLHNVALLVEVVPGELRDVVVDAARFVRDPSQPFNRAQHSGGGFVAGKDGGTYQMHNPGISAVIFPAYFVDRQLAQIVPGSKAQWPEHLPVVNALMLGIYAAWTVLILRFLRRAGASEGVAWITALACTFTLPAAAFPFQYYPELVAGLLVTAIAGHLLFASADRRRRAFVVGMLAGYLPWLHVRFSAVTIAFALAALVIWRADRRRVLSFVGGIAVPVALFSLYTYRISGSVMPSALWTASGDENNFAWLSMVRNSVAYLVDRDWGLFAHSPVFLLALPGYWWMARRQPAVAWMSAAVFLALLLPAAGKTLIQTTPMRLIVAVVPLAATPLIEALSRGGRATRIVFALLLILSLDNAVAYNFHHDRTMDLLLDPSFSGWKVNLLFPYESRQPWQVSTANGVLLILWLSAVASLFVIPTWLDRRPPSTPGGTEWAPGRFVVVTAAIVLVIGTGVAAATGAWTGRRYLITAPAAARDAALMLDELGRCTICYSSAHGPIGAKDATVGARRLLIDLEAIDPSVAARHEAWTLPGYSDWLEMPGRIRAWFQEAHGREPSNGEVGHFMYQWREEHVPAMEIKRRIFTSAGKAPPSS
jgi:hypothetical protein